MDKKDNKAEKFDAIIIGSGQAGNPLAKSLASNGWKVAVIRKKLCRRKLYKLWMYTI